MKNKPEHHSLDKLVRSGKNDATGDQLLSASGADEIREEESSSFFEQFFEEAPLGFHCLDENGKILIVNKAWLEMTGYEKSEVENRWIGDFLTEESVLLFQEFFEQCKTENYKHEIELVAKRKNGSTMLISFSGQPQFDRQGRFLQTLCIIKDISLLKQMEKRLQESEEKYKLLFDRSNDGICFLSHEDEQIMGSFLEVNETYCKMLGYSREEIKNIKPEQTIIPQKLEEIEKIKNALMEKKKLIYETVLRNKNGDEIIVEVNSHLTEYKCKRATVSIIRDITKRKNVEGEVIKKQRQFNNLLNSIKAIILEADHLKLTYVGGRVEQILGYSKRQWLGEPLMPDGFWGKHIHPDDREKAISNFKEAIAKNKDIFLEFRMLAADDMEKWFYCQLSPQKEENEKVRLIMFDISERKLIEKELQQTEEKWRRLIENAPHNILILSENGEILFSNRQLMIFRPESIVGKSIYDIFSPHFRPIAKKNIQRVFDSKESQNFEAEITKNETNDYWYDINIAPLTHQNRVVHALMIASDITQRKKAETELKITTKKLRNLSNRLQKIRENERVTIAREIHDELGQSVTALTMDLYWLKKKIPDNQLVQDKLNQMIKSCDVILQNVNRICSNLHPRILDELGFISALEWQTEEFKKRTHIDCDLIISDKDLTIDKKRSFTLFRIFQEILTNIARHAHATKVTINLQKEKDFILLSVKDNGTGISQQQVSSINSLGIIGMRERLIPFNGRIEFKGEKNKGTRVTVTLSSLDEEREK